MFNLLNRGLLLEAHSDGLLIPETKKLRPVLADLHPFLNGTKIASENL